MENDKHNHYLSLILVYIFICGKSRSQSNIINFFSNCSMYYCWYKVKDQTTFLLYKDLQQVKMSHQSPYLSFGWSFAQNYKFSLKIHYHSTNVVFYKKVKKDENSVCCKFFQLFFHWNSLSSLSVLCKASLTLTGSL